MLETLPLRGGGGRVKPLREKCVYYKLVLVINSGLCYLFCVMTNIIYFLAGLVDCVVLTLEVLAKILFNFSPALFLILAFVGIKNLVAK